MVLAVSDYYFPGDKGGGAVHALANMVSRLVDDWDFKVITRDRDFGDAVAYPNVASRSLYMHGNAGVIYISPMRRLRKLLALVRNAEFDVLYLNSFFSPAFSFPLLLFRKFRLIAERPMIVAPRGEFSPGALKIKRLKKLSYIFLTRALGLCRGVVWHVSTEYEEADVRRHFGKKAHVVIARDCLPVVTNATGELHPREKVAGELDIVFLSRICRKKNLDGALSMLSDLQGMVRMRIYGPQEDADYWQECKAIIDRLPTNIQVEYCGAVAHDEVSSVMARHHLFFLPTHGENFGFVIFEALLAGCPIMISDQTPWRELQAKGSGWELPLEEPERFRKALQACVNMDQTAFSALSKNARAYGLQTIRTDSSAEQSKHLFEIAIGTQS